ncbi:MAG TPA: nitroreductase family protein, partial [Gammaproteobacteria bacterium]|nr:nitroreductase family protein [Gammaproteobacteria bacterium]
MNDRTVSLPPIQLPEPVKWKAIPLFAALEQRRTTREISDTALSEQQLANLLWAAFGVNRKTGPFGLPGRTAASASNSQEIDIYVALRDGVYLYNALDNRLEPLIAEDLRVRALTPGQQDIPSVAPVQLIFVADIDRMTHTQGFEEPGLHDPEIQK